MVCRHLAVLTHACVCMQALQDARVSFILRVLMTVFDVAWTFSCLQNHPACCLSVCLSQHACMVLC